MFSGCISLQTVNIPDSVKSINNFAFNGCTSLESVTIPNGLESIGNLAFNNCSLLGVIGIPGTVNNIIACSFRNCHNAVLYYKDGLSAQLASIKSVRANIEYTILEDGKTKLEIVYIASDSIEFPEKVGGGVVFSANWEEHQGVSITHISYPEHNYDKNGNCAICGSKKKLDKPVAPDITIDYINELLVGFESGESYGYSVAGEQVDFAAGGVSLPIKESWFGYTMSIIKKGDGTNTSDSEEQKLVIKARPSAPIGVYGEDETAEGAKDGKIKGVNDKMEYSLAESGDWKEISGTTVENLLPGAYYVRVKAVPDESFHSASIKVTINAYKPQLPPDKTSEAGIDYVDALLTNLTSGAEYIINGESKKASDKGIIGIKGDWIGSTITIVKKGNGSTTSDSGEQKLVIKARPSAPIEVKGEDESEEGENDGKLTSVNDKMEYCLAGSDDWKRISGTTVENLSPGAYYVRVKAVEGESFHSGSVKVIINAHKPDSELPPDKTPEAGIDYVNELLTGLKAGAKYLIDWEEVTASGKGTVKIEERWFDDTISIVKVGDGTTTDDSEEQWLDIKARPSAPVGVKGEDESEEGANDGKLTGVNDKMEYCLAGSKEWKRIIRTTVNNLSSGAYYVRIKAVEGKSFHSDSIKITINAKRTESELPSEKILEAGIDYVDELLTGLTPGAVYLIDWEEKTASGKGTISIEEYWFDDTISIVKAGNGTTTDDSEEQWLDIPARPSAPTGVKGKDESKEGANDGSLTGVSSKMEYSLAGREDWKEISGTTVNNLPPGAYNVRIKAVKDESFHSDNITVNINAYKPEVKLNPEKKPAAKIDYVNEKLTGLISGAVYFINGKEATAGSDKTINISEDWLDSTIRIVKKGDGTTTSNSEAQPLIIPARPAAPTGIGHTDESAEGAKNGEITNVNNKMEYQMEGDSSWNAVKGKTISSLAPGTYYVCYKAVANKSFRSNPAKITINAYVKLDPAQKPAAKIDYVNEKLTDLISGEDYLINEGIIATDNEGKTGIKEAWLDSTISIVKKGDGTTTSDSEAQLLPIPARPAAPTGIEKEDESFKGAGDGKIKNLNTNMEYQVIGDSRWRPVNGTTLDLAPGTYYIRIKAVEGKSFHSDYETVTIEEYELIPEETPEAVIDYRAETIKGLIGGTYTIDGSEIKPEGGA